MYDDFCSPVGRNGSRGGEEAENGVSAQDVSSTPTTEEERIAAGWVKIDEKNFPDEHFRNFVSNGYYGDPDNYPREKIDHDNNGWLSPDEIAAVKWINCSERQIEKLTGIGYFTALTYLNCSDNQLTELDVRKNKALTYLDCSDNQLTELDVSENKALTYLDCALNQLTKLDVSDNTALTELYCIGNQLTELDVSQNTELKILQCSENQLTSLDLENTKLDPDDCWGLVVLSAEKNSYNIVVDPENRFNLSTLPGHFDVSKVKEGSWIGGTVSGDILTFDEGADTVTYTYDCGTTKAEKPFSAEFTLEVTGRNAAPVVPDAPADGGDTDDAADNIKGALSAVVVGAVAGAIIYETGTGIYRAINMPGIPMPSNRIELAELLWERADKPEPVSTALYSDIDESDTDAQKAAHWAVEQDLMQDNSEKNTFNPHFPVSKLRTCLTWNAAKEKGLFDADKTAE